MAASVQERDGAKTTLLGLYLLTPVRLVYADAGFAGMLVDWCQRILRTVLEMVRKVADLKGSPSSLAGGSSSAVWPG
jgi:hypothetical protein